MKEQIQNILKGLGLSVIIVTAQKGAWSALVSHNGKTYNVKCTTRKDTLTVDTWGDDLETATMLYSLGLS